MFLAMLVLASCATRTIVEYRDRVVDNVVVREVHDTISNDTHDSVYIEKYIKGDTFFYTKYNERLVYKDRVVYRNDTCFLDSIVTQYVETTKEIVKIPKIYRISLWFSIICIIFAVIKLLRWLRII